MSWVEAGTWNRVLNVAETCIIVLCIWYFVSHVQKNIEKPARLKKIVFLVLWVGFAGLTFGLQTTEYTQAEVIIYLIMSSTAAGHFLYNNSKMYLFYYFAFSISLIVIQIFIAYIAMGYSISKWGMMVFDYYSANVSTIIKILAEILLTGVWTALLNRKKFEDVTGYQFAGLFLPPAITVFIIFSFIILSNVYVQLYGAFLIIVNIFFLVFMNLYILYLFSYQSKNRKLKEELKLYRKQSEMQYHYYEQLEQKYQSSRKLIHDMRNHLQSVEALYHLNESEAGNTYAKDMHQMLDAMGQKQYTDNRMLNIILNDKAESAEKRNIAIDVKIGEVHLEHMKDMDMTTIFANLLDNAIEAAEGAAGDRYIHMKADSVHDFQAIRICNSYSISEGGRCKENSSHMGIGLLNVKRTLEEYGGGIHIEKNNKEFIVSITIPLSRESIKKEEIQDEKYSDYS